MTSPAIHPHWLRSLPIDERRAEIVRVLETTAGHERNAAARLDMTRMTLWRFLRDLNMLSIPAEIRDRAARRFRLAG